MSDEKTEEPTDKKIRDAREKGQVANSKDVTSTALLVGVFSCIMISWENILTKSKEMILLPMRLMHEPFEDATNTVMLDVFQKMVELIAPFLLIVIVLGIAGNFFQVGPLLAFKSIEPSFEKLDPMAKLKQIFGIKNLIEFIKSSLKTVILSVIVYKLIKEAIDPLMKLPYCGPNAILEILAPLMKHFAIWVTMVYIVVAGFDFFFQKNQHIKQLKMSKDEVKREYKEQEGDPLIKGKRRQLHEELLTQNTVETVKKSTAVVSNPTHVCVAILYEQGRTALPVVTAKGKDHIAKLMRKTAEAAGIPVFENVWLARSLYVDAEQNHFIPREYITPIVEVLKEVQRIKQRQGVKPETKQEHPS